MCPYARIRIVSGKSVLTSSKYSGVERSIRQALSAKFQQLNQHTAGAREYCSYLDVNDAMRTLETVEEIAADGQSVLWASFTTAHKHKISGPLGSQLIDIIEAWSITVNTMDGTAELHRKVSWGAVNNICRLVCQVLTFNQHFCDAVFHSGCVCSRSTRN
jgi:hypothetical protein